MKLKRTTLATALAAALAMGMAGHASADVFAGSALTIQNFVLDFQTAGGVNANPNVAINSFNYTVTNTASLNSLGNITTKTCSGTGTSIGSCGTVPTLYAVGGSVNAPGTSIVRPDLYTPAFNIAAVGADNTLKWYPIGGGNWSNADSVIYSSLLTTGTPTHTDQIAQSNIDTATSGAASSEIISTTGFTLTFTVGGTNPTNMFLDFDADPDMMARILNDTGISFNATANMNTSLTLSKDGAFGVGAHWRPTDGLATDCVSGGGVGCTLTFANTESLNEQVTTSTNNTSDPYSHDPNVAGLTHFGVNMSGLTAGTWTLALQAQTSSQVTRQVPEPGGLALVGIALAGLGFAGRRRKA